LSEAALVELVHAVLKEGTHVTLVPVVSDASQALRSFRAGADAVLLLADGELVNPEDTLRGLGGGPITDIAHPETDTPRARGVLAAWAKVRTYFARPAPRDPIAVDVAHRVDDDLVDAARRLVPRLSSSVPVPGALELDQIIKDPGTRLVVAREGRMVVGMATLHILHATTGIHAWIQDLVVDDIAKGRGVSELLTRKAVWLATSQGARTAALTSRPSHVGKGRLYQRIGFRKRDTHLYRFQLSG
jgi:GNAT superfamily N-acetyltransferase